MQDVNILPLPPKATRRALRSANRKGLSWRKIGAFYGVNQKYVYAFAKDGVKPANIELCYKMGLRRRPGDKPPPTFFQVKRDEMAAETKRVTKGWRRR
jgi:hypothetical protein